MYQPRIINDKGRFILLWMFLCALPINAAPYLMTGTLQDDSVCIYREKVLFPKASAVVSGKFAGNQVHLDSIRSFFSKTGTQKPMSVKVTGSYSPEGKYLFNIKLAKARAQALADILKRLDPSFTPAMSIEHPAWGGYWLQAAAFCRAAGRMPQRSGQYSSHGHSIRGRHPATRRNHSGDGC